MGSFAGLNWTQNTEDPARGALMQRVTERGSLLSQELVFLELELAAAPDETTAAWLADPALAHWRHWLEVVRIFKPHLLSEPEEKLLTEKSVTGSAAWVRFFEEMHGAARYELDGETLTRDQVLSKLYEQDRELRQRAAAAVTDRPAGHAAHQHLLSSTPCWLTKPPTTGCAATRPGSAAATWATRWTTAPSRR